MYFTKLMFHTLLLSSLMLFILSCSDGGVQSGSSLSSFSGVSEVVVLSPTSVKISWTKNTAVKEYLVYQNSNSEPVGRTAFDYFVVENLTPNTNYTFKVVGDTSTQLFGSDKQVQATTWSRFNGITSASAKSLTSIEVSWDYAYTPQKYLIFYRKDLAPDATSTNNWTTASAETSLNKILISGLQNSSKYYFIVHAVYRDAEKEISNKTLSLNTSTSFAAPLPVISTVSIGSVPTVYIDPIEDTTHGENFFKTTVLWNGVPISDPLIGKGQIVVSGSANLPLGKVENISVKIDYADGNKTESMTIEGLVTYIKGMPGNKEIPATDVLSLGSSYMGKVLARGDFNCDGGDDLAVGIPDMSVASIGVKARGAGAVIVYYSKEDPNDNTKYVLTTTGTASISPALGAPLLITFDDLAEDARLGEALAAGNFNGDKNGLFPCDDLLIGAPNDDNIGTRQGAAYMLFGSTKGLSSAGHISDIAVNSPTCNGSLSNAICGPVKLFENHSLIPRALTGNSQLISTNHRSDANDFGAALSFIGDFNADGFDDIAIGAPGAGFDGTLQFGAFRYQAGYTGAVFIFFGSKFGLGYEYPADLGGVIDITDPKVPYLKIYAPVPRDGARFGASIAGGADIDGRNKIRYEGTKYYGGGDFVVGSPGFTYEDFTTQNSLATPRANGGPDWIGTDHDSSSVLESPAGNNWWATTLFPLTNPQNYYGFPQSPTAQIGAAYIYFGRSSNGAAGQDENPRRGDFWKCGRRGMSANEHYSCLYDNTNVKMLTPRSSATISNVRNFGAAVAVIGNKSRFVENSNILNTAQFSDANKDGFADVVVSAPDTQVGAKASVGILQVYYGNASRLFNHGDFLNIYANNTPASDSGNNAVSCTNFSDASNATKRICKPVIISSPSLGVGARIGASSSQFSVGDVSGDGILDLAVGAAGDNVLGSGSGAALVYTSVANGGLSSTYKKIYTTWASSFENLGTSVVIGNFNGDENGTYSYGDLFAGAPFDSQNRSGGGAVYGFYTQDAALPSTLSTHNAFITENLAAFTDYGLGETRLVGDINNDGYTDAVSKITSFQSGGTKVVDAVIYFGSSIGLVTTSFCLANPSQIFKTANSGADCYPKTVPAQGVTLNQIPLPQKILKPLNMDAMWAFLAIEAGDVNKDGFGDVLFIPISTGGSNFSTLFFGSRTGLLNVVDPSWQPATGDPQIVSRRLAVQMGFAQSEYGNGSSNNRSPFIAADFNGDGFSDLAMGLPRDGSRLMNKGNLASPEDQETSTNLGGAVSVNADSGWVCSGGGLADNHCLTGYPISEHGSIRILYGSSAGYQTPARNNLPGDLDRGNILNMAGTEGGVTKPCNQSSNPNAATYSPSPDCTAVYMDNPVFENIEYGFRNLGHSFGSSIAAVDVNKDGFKDLLVSSPGYEDLGCYYSTDPSRPFNYGRVYVFYGGEFGLVAATPRSYYTANIDQSYCPVNFANDPALNGAIVRAIMPSLVGNGGGRAFGTSIATAGDVNGDRWEDFVIATPGETVGGVSGAGAVYIYYGPLCSSDNNNNITDEFQSADNLNTQRYFISSLPAALSDPNLVPNPPLSPVNLGASLSNCYRDGGQAKPMPQKFFVLSAASGENWGLSLLTGKPTKGDFNRDGFDDVIVGSPYYTDAATSRSQIGQGVVFFGSALGLYAGDYPTSSVISTSFDRLRPYAIIPNKYTSGSRFFKKMSPTGDINGDGTMDLLVPSQEYSGEGLFNGVNIGTFLIFN